MNNESKDYLSEFEREFESGDSTVMQDEFESGDTPGDGEYEFDQDSEFEQGDSLSPEGEFESADPDFQSEGDYLSELDSDHEWDGEIEENGDRRYENRLFEIFSNSYENEFEFENDVNAVMHEIERDYFWSTVKKWGKKLAPIAKVAIKAIPGSAGVMDVFKQLTKDPRALLKTLATKFGPQALNMIVPGAGVAASALLANSEAPDVVRQAAKDTVAMAKQSYTNLANGIMKTDFAKNIPAVRSQLNNLAKNSFRAAHQKVRLGSRGSKYRRVGRKVRDAQNGMYKIVTITYRRR